MDVDIGSEVDGFGEQMEGGMLKIDVEVYVLGTQMTLV